MLDERLWDKTRGIYQLVGRNFCSPPLKQAITREKGRDGKQRDGEEGRGGGGGGGSHTARLQAVNNLEEHWGDETKMNTKHWQRLT